MRLTGVLVLVAFVVGGAAGGDKKKPTVSGKITFKAKPTFPRGTEVLIQVQDTSRADAKAITIGEKKLKDPKEEDIPFEVEFDADKVKPRLRYSLSVRITHAGKLLYINDTRIAVINPPGKVKDVKAPVIAVRR